MGLEKVKLLYPLVIVVNQVIINLFTVIVKLNNNCEKGYYSDAGQEVCSRCKIGRILFFLSKYKIKYF